MRWLLTVPLLLVAGCATMAATPGTPLVSCADPQFHGARARLAADVDTPPEPVGGLIAIQERVRIPNAGARIATPEGRFAVVRAVVDTTGAVQCSDMLSAGSDAKGEAARRALHASAFVPGRDAGKPTAVVLDVQLDVRGQGRPTVVRGNQIQG